MHTCTFSKAVILSVLFYCLTLTGPEGQVSDECNVFKVFTGACKSAIISVFLVWIVKKVSAYILIVKETV